ncbi:MAG: hypothetical protein ACYDCO_17200 [Armatimonadota bacterium]
MVTASKPAATWTGRRVTAQRVWYQGAPTIVVNGKPIHGGGVLFRHLSGYGAPSFRKIDPELILPYVFLPVPADATPDYTAITAPLETMFADHPKALGGYILNLAPAKEWLDAHPDELTRYDREIDYAGANAQADASWASQAWRRDSALFVERVARHFHTVFLGRVILYQVGGGSCGENGPLFDPYYGGSWYAADFSEPMTRCFRARLRTYYGNDVDRLRAAWGDPAVTFENARVPSRVERISVEHFALRSPRRCQTADYYRAWSEAVEGTALAWMEAVKRGTDGEALTATPMGSILDCGLCGFMIHQLAKMTFHEAAASPQLDMLQSPATYALRNPGDGDASAMIPLGMARLAGKMWLRDFDTRTHLVAGECDADPVGSLWRTPRNTWEDIQIIIRDAGYSILKGGAVWWHEIHDRMFRLPAHIRAAKRMQAVGRGAVHADRSLMPGLGVFVDNESNFHQANANRLIYAMNYEPRQLHWPHAGMAYDIFHLNDAAHPDMPPHKLMMATNAFWMTEEQAAAITALARRHHATLVWLMAPGVQGPGRFDLEKTSRITGFTIRCAQVEALPRVSLLPGEHPWSTPPLPGGGSLVYFGTGPHDYDDSGARGVGPLFYADVSGDSGVTVLGMLDALREPGFAVRQMDGYTSVYCAAPYLPNELLRQMGKDAGAHLYLDTDDLIHVAADLILVHAKRGGMKEIRWPGRADVVIDLFSGEEIAADTRAWSVSMQRHESRFFFAGAHDTAEQVRQGLREGLTVW